MGGGQSKTKFVQKSRIGPGIIEADLAYKSVRPVVALPTMQK